MYQLVTYLDFYDWIWYNSCFNQLGFGMKLELELLLHQGMSYSQAARALGVSKQYANFLAKKYGLEKIWKEKQPSQLKQKKESFSLGKDLYSICRLKFTRKRQNCRKSGIPFLLNFEELAWPTHCPVLGIPMEYDSFDNRAQEGSPSFDRTDSSLGYIPGNVRIISWRANRIKNDGTAEEHRKIADYIDSYDKTNLVNKL